MVSESVIALIEADTDEAITQGIARITGATAQIDQAAGSVAESDTAEGITRATAKINEATARITGATEMRGVSGLQVGIGIDAASAGRHEPAAAPGFLGNEKVRSSIPHSSTGKPPGHRPGVSSSFERHRHLGHAVVTRPGGTP